MNGEQCADCTADATATLGAVAYCTECREAIRATIRARAFLDESGIGNGVPGLPRPEFGSGYADLTCSNTACAYEWLGRRGEQCGKCATRHEAMQATPKRPTPVHDLKAG